MLSAARSRLGSLRWRFIVGASFATGATFILTSAAAGCGWYRASGMGSLFARKLAGSSVRARGEEARARAGGRFVWGRGFSNLILASMPIMLAAVGGGPRRL